MSAESSGKISLALGGRKKPAKLAPTNGVKRSHAALRDHEEEDDSHARAQTVSHFDQSAGGAIDASKEPKDKGPLVIAPQANRDWKEASRRNKRQRSGKLAEAGDEVQNEDTMDVEEAKPIFGLNVRKRAEDEDAPMTNGHIEHDEAEKPREDPPERNGEPSIKQKTDSEIAMDALLGKTTESTLVLPAMTEEEAFARDYDTAPDMATLDDYARVPVEQFGAALLRGMGWKDGEGIGSQRGKKLEKTAKRPERRPALLGIGAKEEAAVAQEMGVWGKAAKGGKGGGAVQVYNPVLLRDKRTGEVMTEDEVEKKKEREEREKFETAFEEMEKERRRKRDRDGERERRRDSERREKDRRSDRRGGDERDRRRRRDDSDEEYYRKKDKERRRRERGKQEDSDFDRERSGRRHHSDRERHRDLHHRDRRR